MQAHQGLGIYRMFQPWVIIYAANLIQEQQQGLLEGVTIGQGKLQELKLVVAVEVGEHKLGMVTAQSSEVMENLAEPVEGARLPFSLSQAHSPNASTPAPQCL